MAIVHMSEAELAPDPHAVLAKVQQGTEIVIEQDNGPVAGSAWQQAPLYCMSRPITSDRMPEPMTNEAIEKSAAADPDALPLTEAYITRMKRTPQVKVIRRALDLTQEDFAARYHIPLGTLRDWEQGRAEPDQPTQACLTLIARAPEDINGILNSRAR